MAEENYHYLPPSDQNRLPYQQNNPPATPWNWQARHTRPHYHRHPAPLRPSPRAMFHPMSNQYPPHLGVESSNSISGVHPQLIQMYTNNFSVPPPVMPSVEPPQGYYSGSPMYTLSSQNIPQPELHSPVYYHQPRFRFHSPGERFRHSSLSPHHNEHYPQYGRTPVHNSYESESIESHQSSYFDTLVRRGSQTEVREQDRRPTRESSDVDIGRNQCCEGGDREITNSISETETDSDMTPSKSSTRASNVSIHGHSLDSCSSSDRNETVNASDVCINETISTINTSELHTSTITPSNTLLSSISSPNNINNTSNNSNNISSNTASLIKCSQISNPNHTNNETTNSSGTSSNEASNSPTLTANSKTCSDSNTETTNTHCYTPQSTQSLTTSCSKPTASHNSVSFSETSTTPVVGTSMQSLITCTETSGTPILTTSNMTTHLGQSSNESINSSSEISFGSNPNNTPSEISLFSKPNNPNPLTGKSRSVSSKRKKKYKPSPPPELPHPEWSEDDVRTALEVEAELKKRFDVPTLTINFPDPEITEEYVMSLHPDIQCVYFHRTVDTRHCMITLLDESQLENTVSDLVRISMGAGKLRCTRNSSSGTSPLNCVDPCTIYVGNIADHMNEAYFQSQFPAVCHVTVTNTNKLGTMRGRRGGMDRSALLHFGSVQDSLDALRIGAPAMMESSQRKMTVRCRRIKAARSRTDDTSSILDSSSSVCTESSIEQNTSGSEITSYNPDNRSTASLDNPKPKPSRAEDPINIRKCSNETNSPLSDRNISPSSKNNNPSNGKINSSVRSHVDRDTGLLTQTRPSVPCTQAETDGTDSEQSRNNKSTSKTSDTSNNSKSHGITITQPSASTSPPNDKSSVKVSTKKLRAPNKTYSVLSKEYAERKNSVRKNGESSHSGSERRETREKTIGIDSEKGMSESGSKRNVNESSSKRNINETSSKRGMNESCQSRTNKTGSEKRDTRQDNPKTVDERVPAFGVLPTAIDTCSDMTDYSVLVPNRLKETLLKPSNLDQVGEKCAKGDPQGSVKPLILNQLDEKCSANQGTRDSVRPLVEPSSPLEVVDELTQVVRSPIDDGQNKVVNDLERHGDVAKGSKGLDKARKTDGVNIESKRQELVPNIQQTLPIERHDTLEKQGKGWDKAGYNDSQNAEKPEKLSAPNIEQGLPVERHENLENRAKESNKPGKDMSCKDETFRKDESKDVNERVKGREASGIGAVGSAEVMDVESNNESRVTTKLAKVSRAEPFETKPPDKLKKDKGSRSKDVDKKVSEKHDVERKNNDKKVSDKNSNEKDKDKNSDKPVVDKKNSDKKGRDKNSDQKDVNKKDSDRKSSKNHISADEHSTKDLLSISRSHDKTARDSKRKDGSESKDVTSAKSSSKSGNKTIKKFIPTTPNDKVSGETRPSKLDDKSKTDKVKPDKSSHKSRKDETRKSEKESLKRTSKSESSGKDSSSKKRHRSEPTQVSSKNNTSNDKKTAADSLDCSVVIPKIPPEVVEFTTSTKSSGISHVKTSDQIEVANVFSALIDRGKKASRSVGFETVRKEKSKHGSNQKKEKSEEKTTSVKEKSESSKYKHSTSKEKTKQKTSSEKETTLVAGKSNEVSKEHDTDIKNNVTKDSTHLSKKARSTKEDSKTKDKKRDSKSHSIKDTKTAPKDNHKNNKNHCIQSDDIDRRELSLYSTSKPMVELSGANTANNIHPVSTNTTDIPEKIKGSHSENRTHKHKDKRESSKDSTKPPRAYSKKNQIQALLQSIAKRGKSRHETETIEMIATKDESCETIDNSNINKSDTVITSGKPQANTPNHETITSDTTNENLMNEDKNTTDNHTKDSKKKRSDKNVRDSVKDSEKLNVTNKSNAMDIMADNSETQRDRNERVETDDTNKESDTMNTSVELSETITTSMELSESETNDALHTTSFAGTSSVNNTSSVEYMEYDMKRFEDNESEMLSDEETPNIPTEDRLASQSMRKKYKKKRAFDERSIGDMSSVTNAPHVLDAHERSVEDSPVKVWNHVSKSTMRAMDERSIGDFSSVTNLNHVPDVRERSVNESILSDLANLRRGHTPKSPKRPIDQRSIGDMSSIVNEPHIHEELIDDGHLVNNLHKDHLSKVPNQPFDERSIGDMSSIVNEPHVADIHERPIVETSIDGRQQIVNVHKILVSKTPNRPFDERSIGDMDSIVNEHIADVHERPIVEANVDDRHKIVNINKNRVSKTPNRPFDERSIGMSSIVNEPHVVDIHERPIVEASIDDRHKIVNINKNRVSKTLNRPFDERSIGDMSSIVNEPHVVDIHERPIVKKVNIDDRHQIVNVHKNPVSRTPNRPFDERSIGDMDSIVNEPHVVDIHERPIVEASIDDRQEIVNVHKNRTSKTPNRPFDERSIGDMSSIVNEPHVVDIHERPIVEANVDEGHQVVNVNQNRVSKTPNRPFDERSIGDVDSIVSEPHVSDTREKSMDASHHFDLMNAVAHQQRHQCKTPVRPIDQESIGGSEIESHAHLTPIEESYVYRRSIDEAREDEMNSRRHRRLSKTPDRPIDQVSVGLEDSIIVPGRPIPNPHGPIYQEHLGLDEDSLPESPDDAYARPFDMESIGASTVVYTTQRRGVTPKRSIDEESIGLDDASDINLVEHISRPIDEDLPEDSEGNADHLPNHKTPRDHIIGASELDHLSGCDGNKRISPEPGSHTSPYEDTVREHTILARPITPRHRRPIDEVSIGLDDDSIVHEDRERIPVDQRSVGLVSDVGISHLRSPSKEQSLAKGLATRGMANKKTPLRNNFHLEDVVRDDCQDDIFHIQPRIQGGSYRKESQRAMNERSIGLESDSKIDDISLNLEDSASEDESLDMDSNIDLNSTVISEIVTRHLAKKERRRNLFDTVSIEGETRVKRRRLNDLDEVSTGSPMQWIQDSEKSARNSSIPAQRGDTDYPKPKQGHTAFTAPANSLRHVLSKLDVTKQHAPCNRPVNTLSHAASKTNSTVTSISNLYDSDTVFSGKSQPFSISGLFTSVLSDRTTAQTPASEAPPPLTFAEPGEVSKGLRPELPAVNTSPSIALPTAPDNIPRVDNFAKSLTFSSYRDAKNSLEEEEEKLDENEEEETEKPIVEHPTLTNTQVIPVRTTSSNVEHMSTLKSVLTATYREPRAILEEDDDDDSCLNAQPGSKLGTDTGVNLNAPNTNLLNDPEQLQRFCAYRDTTTTLDEEDSVIGTQDHISGMTPNTIGISGNRNDVVNQNTSTQQRQDLQQQQEVLPVQPDVQPPRTRSGDPASTLLSKTMLDLPGLPEPSEDPTRNQFDKSLVDKFSLFEDSCFDESFPCDIFSLFNEDEAASNPSDQDGTQQARNDSPNELDLLEPSLVSGQGPGKKRGMHDSFLFDSDADFNRGLPDILPVTLQPVVKPINEDKSPYEVESLFDDESLMQQPQGVTAQEAASSLPDRADVKSETPGSVIDELASMASDIFDGKERPVTARFQLYANESRLLDENSSLVDNSIPESSSQVDNSIPENSSLPESSSIVENSMQDCSVPIAADDTPLDPEVIDLEDENTEDVPIEHIPLELPHMVPATPREPSVATTSTHDVRKSKSSESSGRLHVFNTNLSLDDLLDEPYSLDEIRRKSHDDQSIILSDDEHALRKEKTHSKTRPAYVRKRDLDQVSIFDDDDDDYGSIAPAPQRQALSLVDPIETDAWNCETQTRLFRSIMENKHKLKPVLEVMEEDTRQRAPRRGRKRKREKSDFDKCSVFSGDSNDSEPHVVDVVEKGRRSADRSHVGVKYDLIASSSQVETRQWNLNKPSGSRSSTPYNHARDKAMRQFRDMSTYGEEHYYRDGKYGATSKHGGVRDTLDTRGDGTLDTNRRPDRHSLYVNGTVRNTSDHFLTNVGKHLTPPVRAPPERYRRTVRDNASIASDDEDDERDHLAASRGNYKTALHRHIVEVSTRHSGYENMSSEHCMSRSASARSNETHRHAVSSEGHGFDPHRDHGLRDVTNHKEDKTADPKSSQCRVDTIFNEGGESHTTEPHARPNTADDLRLLPGSSGGKSNRLADHMASLNEKLGAVQQQRKRVNSNWEDDGRLPEYTLNPGGNTGVVDYPGLATNSTSAPATQLTPNISEKPHGSSSVGKTPRRRRRRYGSVGLDDDDEDEQGNTSTKKNIPTAGALGAKTSVEYVQLTQTPYREVIQPTRQSTPSSFHRKEPSRPHEAKPSASDSKGKPRTRRRRYGSVGLDDDDEPCDSKKSHLQHVTDGNRSDSSGLVSNSVHSRGEYSVPSRESQILNSELTQNSLHDRGVTHHGRGPSTHRAAMRMSDPARNACSTRACASKPNLRQTPPEHQTLHQNLFGSGYAYASGARQPHGYGESSGYGTHHAGESAPYRHAEPYREDPRPHGVTDYNLPFPASHALPEISEDAYIMYNEPVDPQSCSSSCVNLCAGGSDIYDDLESASVVEMRLLQERIARKYEEKLARKKEMDRQQRREAELLAARKRRKLMEKVNKQRYV